MLIQYKVKSLWMHDSKLKSEGKTLSSVTLALVREWAVSFMIHLLHSWEVHPITIGQLSGPQRWCGCFSKHTNKFYVHVSVHHKSIYLEDQRDAVLSSLYLLYFQVTLHVSGVSCARHQEYTNCSYNQWYKSWIWRCSGKIHLKSPWSSSYLVVAARPWNIFKRILSLHLQIHDLY
jgi:hypothetical protein